ncbi:unnamed protein product, partial [Prorocentrum cordatum]
GVGAWHRRRPTAAPAGRRRWRCRPQGSCAAPPFGLCRAAGPATWLHHGCGDAPERLLCGGSGGDATAGFVCGAARRGTAVRRVLRGATSGCGDATERLLCGGSGGDASAGFVRGAARCGTAMRRVLRGAGASGDATRRVIRGSCGATRERPPHELPRVGLHPRERRGDRHPRRSAHRRREEPVHAGPRRRVPGVRGAARRPGCAVPEAGRRPRVGVRQEKPGVGLMCSRLARFLGSAHVPPAAPHGALEAVPVWVHSAWVHAPEHPAPLALRVAPDIGAPRTTGSVLVPGEEFAVSEELLGAGGVLYLRLSDGRGWAFDRKPGVGSTCSRRSPASPPDPPRPPRRGASRPPPAPLAGRLRPAPPRRPRGC